MLCHVWSAVAISYLAFCFSGKITSCIAFSQTCTFFLSGFSFTDIDNSQDSGGREGTIVYFTLPLLPAHEHSDIYLQLCMWGEYHVFVVATLVFTRLLLDEIYQLMELPLDWSNDDAIFVCLLDELILGFCYSDFDIGNRWLWTRINDMWSVTTQLSIWSSFIVSLGEESSWHHNSKLLLQAFPIGKSLFETSMCLGRILHRTLN